MTDLPPEPTVKKPRPKRPVGSASRTTPARPRKAVAAPVPVAPAHAPLRRLAIVAALTIAIDQLLKWFVVHHLDLKSLAEIEVWEPWLNLRMAWNEGVNFGLFASSAGLVRWLLIAVALAVCVWVLVWVARTRPGRFGQIAAGLLVGGALGNVIDRVVYGSVADFLNMSLPAWRNPYSFNVADIAIFAGAIGLVLQPPEKPRDAGGAAR